ncbi:cytochrome P450 domain-containing protein [Rhizoctonia solani AG-1 IA]|uniref:Cytochrome P450 domain-containing protein n=1 Tax=Thanatephorus cucumeris (strain AG1-IA) TaxID=983506 RepID=L8X0H9_THACA|nr:cytochrome P450 domain-containing protein [Rhizoctonia solani AG-1 IA]
MLISVAPPSWPRHPADDHYHKTKSLVIHDPIPFTSRTQFLSLIQPPTCRAFTTASTRRHEPCYTPHLIQVSLSILPWPPSTKIRFSPSRHIDDTLLKGNLGRVLGFYNATQVVISKDGSIYQNSSVPEVTGLENHPLVAFNVPLGVRKLLIMRERFRIELRGGQGEMYRTQLPLAVHSINATKQVETMSSIFPRCGSFAFGDPAIKGRHIEYNYCGRNPRKNHTTSGHGAEAPQPEIPYIDTTTACNGNPQYLYTICGAPGIHSTCTPSTYREQNYKVLTIDDQNDALGLPSASTMSSRNLLWNLSSHDGIHLGLLTLVAGMIIAGKLCHWGYKGWFDTSRLPPSPKKHWFWGNRDFLTQPYRHVLLGTKYKEELGSLSYKLPSRTKYLLDIRGHYQYRDANEYNRIPQYHGTRHRASRKAAPSLGWGTSPAFRQHDEVHKRMRRMMASALNPEAARSYALQHLDMTLNFLRRIAADPSSFLGCANDVNGAFMIQLAYGYVIREEKDPILSLVHDAVRYLARATTNYYVVNDFPLLKYIPGWFPGAEFKRFGRAGFERRTRYANEMFNMKQGQVERPSYASGLLESQSWQEVSESDTNLIKWTAASLFTDAIQKAQAEIDSVVGRERIPNLQDRDSLPYTEAVLLEVMRFCPPAPLATLQPRPLNSMAIKSVKVQLSMLTYVLRDPSHFSSPHIFDPSRFLRPKPEPDPRRFIFGFGRRVCPGQHVANNGAWMMCAGLLSVFDIRAGPQLEAKVASLGGRESERLYELTEPYGLTMSSNLDSDPLPFDCDIRPRDAAAGYILESSA